VFVCGDQDGVEGKMSGRCTSMTTLEGKVSSPELELELELEVKSRKSKMILAQFEGNRGIPITPLSVIDILGLFEI
jgi:hypothetical protein